MPEVPLTIVVAAALAVIAILQQVALMRVRRADVDTDTTAVRNEQERGQIARAALMDQIAATALKNSEQLSDARVVAERALSDARVSLIEVGHIKQDNARLERRIVDNDMAYKSQIDVLNTQISELQAQVKELKDLLKAKTDEQADAAATIADLRSQLASRQAEAGA